jgi:hypothetical protein
MLKTPSTISKITTMADGGLRLQVDTQELASEDKAELMGLYNQLGWFVFAPTNTIKAEDIPTTPLEENQKTPSQRIRSTLFVYFKKLQEVGSLKPDSDFEVFYRHHTEKYIDNIKNKISEL